MASSPHPPALEDLGDRRFSFYPPILNIEHNEWVLKKGSWSEMLVFNPKMDIELWIPRAWIGEISRVDEPVMIVGLKREVEYKGGTVVPHHRRVIDMPRINTPAPVAPEEVPHERGAVDEFRSSLGAESSVGKLLAGVVLAGIVLTFVIVGTFRLRDSGGTVEFKPVIQANLGFTAQSDYYDVVQKLGEPDQDRWRSESGERQYRALTYRKNDLVVILMGADRNSAHYIGAKDLEWRNVHSVDLPGGRNTSAILRSVPKF